MVLDDFGNVMDNLARGNLWIIGRRTQHEQCPAAHTHEQGNGSLVHTGQTLQGYAHIADTEEDNNTNCKCRHVLLIVFLFVGAKVDIILVIAKSSTGLFRKQPYFAIQSALHGLP